MPNTALNVPRRYFMWFTRAKPYLRVPSTPAPYAQKTPSPMTANIFSDQTRFQYRGITPQTIVNSIP